MNIQSSPKGWHFDIVLCDGFVLTELAAIIDTLRISNRTVAPASFSWSFHSEGGGIRKNPCGVMVETSDIPQRPQADFLFVLGNSDPHHPDLAMRPVLGRYAYAGARIFLLSEAATRYIREEGVESHHTTHWENSTLLRERLGYIEIGNQLSAQDGQIVTCAGLEATVDIVLVLLGELLSLAAQTTVANILLHDKVRDPSTLQPPTAMATPGASDPEIDSCVALMQQNIEHPLSMSRIAETIGVSLRTLERKFQSQLGVSPKRFYREIRMHRANNLLLNTNMSVRDVGLACGFPNGFSGLYKAFFGLTPAARRRKRLAPAKAF
ncbi:helix-turn-helix domain-containing protein [Epibacterium sp. SM1969]|uniref:Helix-turn-helix domain-containing protein n=1 Tax=Tritonibacter aquimaris TaxID=2663379 RepID=A0A844AX63_9RHOB|nr:helix-turn-helix domain-containing protein [Tritonibacter aquimaris]MQY41766.1 helix-turn-helix domain-containing protein [Tritonibacter aquimaris]